MGALNHYRAALRSPGIPRVVAATFTCRLLSGMVSLALLLAAQDASGSYADAGLVTGAYAVALTFTSPLWGRVSDVRGLRASLLLATLLQALAFTAFLLVAALAPAPLLLAAAALVVGACTPPSGAVSNTVFTTCATGEEQRRTLLALSGLMTESVFVFGPLLVAAVVALFSPFAAVVSTAVVSAAGALWLAGAAAVAAVDRRAAERPRHGGFSWPAGQNRILLTIALAAMAIGAVQVTTVAHADGIGASAGLLMTVTACGGMLGSFLYGGTRLPGSQTRQLTVVLGLYAAAIAVLVGEPALLWTLLALFLVGFVNGPADAMEAAVVFERSTPENRSQAYGLLISANWIGFAAGSALAGLAVEHSTPGLGAVVGTVTALAAACALLQRRPARDGDAHTGDRTEKGVSHVES
ncbi:MFS transporter [Streptomyces sp. NPDC053367]|uniref:MFS transporter n=1 Tax=Streptomyces sp. NPDC053367 TaxID=3365700 RepID=UPI0037CF1198